jgi:hypothetical protein
MMKARDLEDRFLRITGREAGVHEEIVELLCETEWIRILVVLEEESPGPSIEVELALPSCIIEPELPQESSCEGCTGARAYLEKTIDHLKYLMRLEDAGLTLGVMSKDGIWSAFTTLSERPSNGFFELLLPPMEH